MQTKRKPLATLLLCILLLCSMCIQASAAETATLTTTLNGTTLTISGEGLMPNYASTTPPWADMTFKTAILNEGLISVGVNAFKDHTSLTKVSLPSSLQRIYALAFYNTGLTAISIPEGVIGILNYAFANTKLTSVVIPDSISHVGQYVFENCTNLKQVTIGSGLEIIGAYMFQNSGLTSVVLPDNIKTVGLSAFNGCTSLSSVTLNEGLVTLSASAFYNTALTSIYIPSTVTTIGASAVGYTSNGAMENFTIYGCAGSAAETYAAENNFTFVPYSGSCGENLTWSYDPATTTLTIEGSGAMYDYTSSSAMPWYNVVQSISKIVLPEGLTHIGDYAFYKAGVTSGSLTTNFPSTLKSIGNRAFCDATLTSLELPEGLTTIDVHAFDSNKKLTSVSLSESLTSLGEYAFASCTKLTALSLPSELKVIPTQAFAHCYSLAKLDLPDALTQIGSGAFYKTILTEVDIPDSVTSIGTDAFSYYTTSSGTTPPTLTLCGKSGSVAETYASANDYVDFLAVRGQCGDALFWSYDLDKNALTVTGSGAMYNYDELYMGTTVTPWGHFNADMVSVTLPEGITHIGDNAFGYFWSLKSVNLPEGLISVGDYAFAACDKLAGYTLPSTLTTVGDYAFDFTAVTSLVLPDALTTIGLGAFAENPKLSSLTLGSGMTSIPTYAFHSCALTQVTIPSTVKTIGDYAFGGNNTLTQVSIPQGVTSIGERAFLSKGLTQATVPASVTTIGNQAFGYYYDSDSRSYAAVNSFRMYGFSDTAAETYADGHSHISFVSLRGKCGDNLTFYYNPNTKTLTITGSGAMYDYDYTETSGTNGPHPWYTVRYEVKKVVLPEGLTAIGDYAFCGLGYTLGHAEINFPSTLTSIGDHALDFAALTDLILPEGLKTIGECAFANSETLKTAYVPGSVTSWGKDSFQNTSLTTLTIGEGVTHFPDCVWFCNDLSSVNLPSTLTSIDEYAFYDCTSLSEIQLPDGLKTIGQHAFGNTGLTAATIPKSVTSIGTMAFGYVYDADSSSHVGVNDFRIYGYAGTAAETYANAASHIIFVPLSGQCGNNLNFTYDSDTGVMTFTGSGAMYDYDSGKLPPWFDIRGEITDVLLPEGLTHLGGFAFLEAEQLTELKLPSTLTSIGNYAASYTGLEQLTLPEGVTSIGMGGFYCSPSLETVNLPDSLTALGSYAFFDCTALSSVCIGSGLSTLPELCFGGCTSLDSVSIPVNITSIDSSAFAGVGSSEVSPASFTIYGYTGTVSESHANSNGFTFVSLGGVCGDNLLAVFDPDTGTLTISGSGAMYNYGEQYDEDENYLGTFTVPWAAFLDQIDTLVLPEGLTHIGDEAFAGLENVPSVTLPSTLTSIGYSAFESSGLTSISFPDSLVFIDGNTFANCENLISATLPDAECGSGIFINCDALSNVTIEKGVTQIPISAFSSCPALKSVTIPASVTTIQPRAFQSCTALSSVTLSEGLKTIAEDAFQDTALKSITIPASVTTIRDYSIGYGFYDFETYEYPVVEGFVIQGYVGTAAETYAVENPHITFIALSSIPTPTITSVSSTLDGVLLKWNAEEDVSRYAVYCSTDGKTYKWLAGPYTNSYTHTAAVEGATYYYKVCCYDGSTVGDKSESVSITYKKPIPVPAKPYKITNVVSGVHVYWKAVDGISKYGIWRSETGANGTYKWLGNPTVPHFTDTTAQSGKTYHYRITSMMDNSHSGKSDSIGIVYVSTPDITSRSNEASGIKLGWGKITGATGYAIYRKSYDGSDAWVRIATIAGNSTFTWTDESVKNSNGTAYRYTIRALAGGNMSTLSGCRNTGRTMVRLSSQVLKTAAKAGGTSIQCSWTTSSKVTGYEVRFLVNGTNYKTFTISNYKTGTKTFTGLKSGQTYDIQIRTYKKVDDVGSFYSAWSAAKSVTL